MEYYWELIYAVLNGVISSDLQWTKFPISWVARGLAATAEFLVSYERRHNAQKSSGYSVQFYVAFTLLSAAKQNLANICQGQDKDLSVTPNPSCVISKRSHGLLFDAPGV